MATQTQTQTKAQPAGTTAEEGWPCQCCQPPSKLHLRPDLGMDGSQARFAVCIVSQLGRPAVHEWDGQKYVLKEDYKLGDGGNAVVDSAGRQVNVQRPLTPEDVMTMADDESPGGAVRTTPDQRVDLGPDRFYAEGGQ